MKPNVGGIDRAFRAVVGLAIIGIGVYFNSWWGALGVVPLATAAIRWCPVYVPFGTTTAKVSRRPEATGSPAR